MESDQISGEFRPEQIPRRGEFLAWSTTLLVGFAWFVLYINNRVVHKAIPFLAFVLLVSSLSISLGNWMDRQTVIKVYKGGIAFRNGLRNVKFNWNEINQVREHPTRWGSKIQVFGEEAFFEFRTLGEVRLSSSFTGKIGFKQGDDIMKQIITNAGLQMTKTEGEAYYYIRQ